VDRINELLTRNRNVSMGAVVLATDDFSSSAKHLIAAPNSTDTIWVQKITCSVTTDAAQTQTFQDTAGTPIKVAAIKASPGVGVLVFDFGTEGFPLTAGKGLDYKNGAAGVAAAIAVQAYAKKTTDAAITPNVPGTFGGI
jgi:hypothetical protein